MTFRVAMAATPAEAPASTKPAAPNVLALPPGFIRVAVAGRAAMCEPAEEAWVRSSLLHAPAGTQPSTRPADMISRIQFGRDALQAQISDRLDLKDPQTASHYVGETLLPLIDRLSRLRVHIVYLVAKRDDLKQLVIGGWGGDQFHYNRVADKIAFNGVIDASLDGAGGESVEPALFLQDESIQSRSKDLSENIGRTEAGINDTIARQARSAVQLSLARFIINKGIAPLNLKFDQQWFSAGLTAQLSSQFLATITGADARETVAEIAQPDPNNPVDPASIDLAHPIPPDQLRPEIAGAYADAFRRRSLAVVASWVDRAGPDAIRKTLAAIKLSPPPDCAALVTSIRGTTGVDLASDLPPQ